MESRPSYSYWQKHGDEWLTEYDRRKRVNVSYNLQEAMIADYFYNSAPVRALEYGCGTGRHLRYLNQITDVEIYGVDQSWSILKGLNQWATPRWIRHRIALIDPRGYVPYPNNWFDIVYTVEVLVHTPPEDLRGVLLELLRVSRWQILHIETAPDYKLSPDAHDGCWYHDLCEEYSTLGYQCEILPKGYEMHVPARITLDEKRSMYTWSSAYLSILRKTEENLQGSIDDLQARIRDSKDLLKEEQTRASDLSEKEIILRKELSSHKEEIKRLSYQLQMAHRFESQMARILSKGGEKPSV